MNDSTRNSKALLQTTFEVTLSPWGFYNRLIDDARIYEDKWKTGEISLSEFLHHIPSEKHSTSKGDLYRIEYQGEESRTITDPATGAPLEITERTDGIRFDIDMRPGERCSVIASCFAPEFKDLFCELLPKFGVQVSEADNNAPPQTPKPVQQTMNARGAKVGTYERVREMHRLLKSGMSQRQAKKQAGCDPSTYFNHCAKATGEEPIVPYR